MRALTKLSLFAGISFTAILYPAVALAHCPLCTAGAGLVAVGAYWVGAKAITIGVLLGTFATAMSIWLARLIKRQFIPHQKIIIAVSSWVFTLVPLRMLFSDYVSWYVSWFGNYGSIFNRTYTLNLFWVGAAVGTILTVMAPAASRYLTKLRSGQHFSFQGLTVNLILAAFAALIVQLL